MKTRLVAMFLVVHGLATALVAGAGTPAEQVAALLAEWNRPGSPGCAVGVVQDGELVFKRGYGEANLDHGIPITSRTVFDIGSVSKQFTAATVVLLAQQGDLSLDDDIRGHLPEMPDYGSTITVRHLLHHTSGIRDYLTVMGLAGLEDHDVYTLDEVVQVIARQKRLNFEPGAEFLYSNSGYILLAEIAERVSGKEFVDLADELIFGPLSMEDSLVYMDSSAVIPRRSTGYSTDEDRFVVDHYYNFAVPGDGQVYTTIEDLARWDRAFSEGGLGEGGLVETMYTRGVLNDGDEIRYALGLAHGEHRGIETIGHGGAWGGFRASLMRFPSEQTSVFALCNFGEISAGDVAASVADVFLADRYPEREEVGADTDATTAAAAALEMTEEQLSVLTGLYYDESSGLLRRILVGDGGLIYDRGRGSSVELEPIGPRRFRMVGLATEVTVQFEPEEGESASVKVMVPGDDDIVMRSVDEAEYSAEEMAAFAGDFRSEELGVTYRLSVEEDALQLRFGSEHETLEAGFRDFFTGPYYSLKFDRDGSGDVAGFIVDAGRVRDIGFVRVE